MLRPSPTTSEQLWQKTLLAGTDAQTDVLYQDNHLAYDALNRLRVAGTDPMGRSNHKFFQLQIGHRSKMLEIASENGVPMLQCRRSNQGIRHAQTVAQG
jgi:hypothetical protein